MDEKTLLLVLSFLLTTVLGGFWGFMLKRRSWQTETEHSIHQARFDEGTMFLDDLSELVGRRYFLLQRLLWSIQDGDNSKTLEREKEYFVTVCEWNSKFWRNRNKIRLLVGEDQANGFLNYRDDMAYEHPESLHYKFVVTHRKVMAAKSDNKLEPAAVIAVTELNWKCSVFLERLTSDFIKRAAALQLLQVPSGPGGAEQAVAADAERRRR
jgi:hypothetical protein